MDNPITIILMWEQAIFLWVNGWCVRLKKAGAFIDLDDLGDEMRYCNATLVHVLLVAVTLLSFATLRFVMEMRQTLNVIESGMDNINTVIVTGDPV